ncbi:MAG: tripartite tricarboxylate transporter substrate binding protein [Burkholderiales bacterium]
MTKLCIALARVCALQILITLSGNAAAEQPYPSKPVRFIVPFAPGGGTDITARLIGQKLSELWNVPVVIDNRPGAGSTVGTDMAAKAAPDGYTIGVTSMSHPINATLYRTLPYDSMKDFEFIMLTVRVPNVLVVHPSVPAKSVKELVALARSQPGRLNFPSSGVGGVSHLAAEVFCATAGIEGVHVPYKGAGPAMTALISGEGQVMMATIPVLLPQMKANRVRPLAISSLKRSPLMAELPTIAESGYPGFETDSWFGLLAPARTPAKIVQKVNADTTSVLSSAELRAALAQQGAQPGGGTPQAFTRFMQAEIVKWRQTIVKAHIPLAN